jgi:hypothetical protein
VEEIQMAEQEDTCGQELAAGAVIPEQLGALFKHVAENLRDHAAWVGSGSPAAKREQEAMLATAQRYAGLSAQAEETAGALRALAQLPAAEHDASKLDRKKLAAWMKTKIELQRKLAGSLLEHAEESQRVLDELTAS